MTLDDAIKYHQAQTIHYRDLADLYETYNDKEDAKMNIGKATEHYQVTEWLKELREWKKLSYVCGNDDIVVFKKIKEERKKK